MRFEKGHKEVTRKRIIEVASRRFRKDGVAASGLAGIMADSGLTNGAFYAHFGSKEDLVRESLSSALSDQLAKLQQTEGAIGIEGAIRRYLNTSHLEGCEEGCPSAALLPEISRQPVPTRKAYEEQLLAYAKTLGTFLPNPLSTQSKQQIATAIFSLMVGTLQMARAVSDPLLAEEILEGGVQAALSLAKA